MGVACRRRSLFGLSLLLVACGASAAQQRASIKLVSVNMDAPVTYECVVNGDVAAAAEKLAATAGVQVGAG